LLAGLSSWQQQKSTSETHTAQKREQKFDYFGKKKLRKIKLLLHAWKTHYAGKFQTTVAYRTHKLAALLCT